MPTKNTDVPFQTVIDALMDTSTPFPGSYLTRFSDIQSSDLELLKETWPTIKPKKKLTLVEELIKLNDQSTLVCFDDVGSMFLSDEDTRIRTAGIRLLRESEDHRLVSKFIQLVERDKQVVVRAAAAGALGAFVLLGELDKISPEKLHLIERTLLPRITGTDDDLVRRSSLEAMGYSSRKEMERLISDAFEESDPDWVASALVAMGRSASEDWEMRILRSLFHPDSVVRMEAIRAAGALSLARAVEPLLEMLDSDSEMGKELRYAAIWALSEIGGEKASAALEALLDNAETDEEAEFVEEAIENVGFGSDALGLDFLDLENLRAGNSGESHDLDEDEETWEDDESLADG
jgi:HEAT repeat protein